MESKSETSPGLVLHESSFEPRETMDRVAAAVAGRGIAILARIDHAAAASKAGLSLRPTEVLIFGNAKAGTPLMHAQQTIGIDLPLKMLVFEDADAKTWVAWNDPEWLAARHGVKNSDAVLQAMSDALADIAREALRR